MNWMQSAATLLVLTATAALAQSPDKPAPATQATAEAQEAAIQKRAAEWVGKLELTDSEKQQRVIKIVADQLRTTRDWHNEHPFTTVPEGINPANGKPLSKGDRQFIADTAIPPTVRQQFLAALAVELTPEQIITIKDQFSEGKVAFTMKGYYAIVPNLTDEEARVIRGFLEEARELALDVKVRSDMTNAAFEIYKTKAEQYLNSNGRNWKEMYSAYTKKLRDEKAAKAATKPATQPAGH